MFTPDGRTAYFGRTEQWNPVDQSVIYETRRTHRGWSTPVVASFSGAGLHDLDPFVTADGKALYFASARSGDTDLYVVRRNSEGNWGEPAELTSVTTGHGELYPSIASDGSIYFASDRPGGQGGWDIHRANPREDGTFGPAENLGPRVNSGQWDFNPALVPGGMVFVSLDRQGGQGIGDLWFTAKKPGGDWTTPRNLGTTVNTSGDEFHPSFDRLFYVHRTYEPLLEGDIYTIPTWCLLRPAP